MCFENHMLEDLPSAPWNQENSDPEPRTIECFYCSEEFEEHSEDIEFRSGEVNGHKYSEYICTKCLKEEEDN